MRSLIDRAVNVVGDPGAVAAERTREDCRPERLYIRLYSDDRQLLAERAAARGMPSATYLAVLARSHLRNLPPLPEAERRAFERGVAELSTIGRNINQIARRVNQGGAPVALRREDLAQFIRVCAALLDHFKTTLKTNKISWESGYESANR